MLCLTICPYQQDLTWVGLQCIISYNIKVFKNLAFLKITQLVFLWNRVDRNEFRVRQIRSKLQSWLRQINSCFHQPQLEITIKVMRKFKRKNDQEPKIILTEPFDDALRMVFDDGVSERRIEEMNGGMNHVVIVYLVH